MQKTHLTCPAATLFQAIMTEESNGDINFVRDRGQAIGPFQIHQNYWDDAVAYDLSLTANDQTYQNYRVPGSIEYYAGKKACIIYFWFC